MTLDLNAPEVQAAIKAEVDKATAGLVAKRDELLSELKGAKAGSAKAAELEAKLAKIEEEKLRGAGDFASLEKQLKDAHARELEKLQGTIKAKQTALEKHLVDAGLSTALAEVGVAKEFLPAVHALLRGQVQIADNAGELSAVAGGKALPDFIKEWAQSDAGKAFVSAPNNSGGGAPGGGKGNVKQYKTKADFKGDPAAKSAFVKEHGGKAFNDLPAA